VAKRDVREVILGNSWGIIVLIGIVLKIPELDISKVIIKKTNFWNTSSLIALIKFPDGSGVVMI
jgi:hypothetical protein